MTFLGLNRVPIEILLSVILAIFIFIATIINTDAALIFLIFSMLLSPEFIIGHVPGREIMIRADDVFLFLIFFGWMAKMAINKDLGLLKTSPLNRIISIYIFISLISTFAGLFLGSVNNILRSMFFIIKYVEYYMLYFMVLNNIKDMKQAKKYVYLILFVSAIVSVFAIWLASTGFARVTAPFEGPEGEANTLAGYLVLMWALALGLFLYSEIARQRWALMGLLILHVPPFLYTLSRGGWIGFFPMYLSFIFFSRRAKLALIGLFCIGLFVLPFVSPGEVKARFLETFTPFRQYEILGYKVPLDESFSNRIDSWGETFKKFYHSPFLGYGVPARLVIDNQYSRVLEETGIIGSAVFIWLGFSIFKLAKHTYAVTHGNNFAQGLTLGYIAGFIGILVVGLGSAVFIIIRIMEPFWFLTAIIAKLPELIAAEPIGES